MKKIEIPLAAETLRTLRKIAEAEGITPEALALRFLGVYTPATNKGE